MMAPGSFKVPARPAGGASSQARHQNLAMCPKSVVPPFNVVCPNALHEDTSSLWISVTFHPHTLHIVT